MKSTRKWIFGFIFSVICIPVNASLLTFEGMQTYSSTYSSGGYDFSFDFAGWAIDYRSDYNNNGTVALLGQGDGNYVDISLTSGDSFDISAFDASIMFTSYSTGDLFVTGFLSGGGSVTETFSLDTSFTNFSLSSAFTGLDVVRFGELGGSPNWLGSAGLVIDNLNFSAASTVPEPSLLALFGLGLTGLGLSHRRKSQA